jgi:hypothetical protein
VSKYIAILYVGALMLFTAGLIGFCSLCILIVAFSFGATLISDSVFYIF